jgi:hypothetical protein
MQLEDSNLLHSDELHYLFDEFFVADVMNIYVFVGFLGANPRIFRRTNSRNGISVVMGQKSIIFGGEEVYCSSSTRVALNHFSPSVASTGAKAKP